MIRRGEVWVKCVLEHLVLIHFRKEGNKYRIEVARTGKDAPATVHLSGSDSIVLTSLLASSSIGGGGAGGSGSCGLIYDGFHE